MIKKWEKDQEANSKKLLTDYSLIDVTEIDGIDHSDAPDFCDAFIASADYDGRPMTQEELDEINDDNDFRYQAVCDWIW